MSDDNIHEKEQLASSLLDYENIIECAYNAILLRPSDDAGRTYWAGRLAEKHSEFKEFLSFLFSSAEFATKLRPFLHTYVEPDLPLINDHSQNGEISILLTNMINSAARHRIVVDAGAHGKMGSNSYDLLRHFAWRGVLIEANPELAEKIRLDFQGLDYQLFPVAVSNFTGTTSLYLGVHPEISSIRRDKTAFWGEVNSAIEVPVEKLSDILQRAAIPKDFDLLSIDTEGEDHNILSDIVAHGFRPEWIIIEAYIATEIEHLHSLPLPQEIIREYDIVGRTFPNLILHRRASQ